MELLQIVPLILENLPFLCITAIFLNKDFLESNFVILVISNFVKSFNLSSIGPRAN